MSAITQADLVLIPLQASGVDARQASRAVALIREEEEALGDRKISFRILLTRTNPIIATKIEKEIIAALTAADLLLLATRLHERQAYKAVFVRRLALHELDAAQVNGLTEALTNAQQLADEVSMNRCRDGHHSPEGGGVMSEDAFGFTKTKPTADKLKTIRPQELPPTSVPLAKVDAAGEALGFRSRERAGQGVYRRKDRTDGRD